ncbi:MAG: CotH kinase family protein [Bacteroidetes bacterium]|nr:CotH kinase family protein [Bacteroidota bacterium]
MIVKDRSLRTVKHRLKRLLAGILILSAASLVLFVFSFVFIPKDPVIKDSIYCGAEEKKLKGSDWVFVNQGHVFRNGDSQTNQSARTGKYSSQISGNNHFGLYYELNGYGPWDRYYASVWRKRDGDFPGALVVNIQGKENYYYEETKSSQTDEEGWEKLEIVFTVPAETKFAAVYVFGSGIGRVYFDDLEIHHIDKNYAKSLSAKVDTVLPKLHLHIDQVGMRKLNRLREKALDSHILITPQDPWVNGKIVEGEETTPVELRLKGDWVDHLRTDKWSFRIKVKPPFAWERLITFSIQNPRSRYYLHEWLYHQLLTQEDILTTRYDFAHITLNDEPKGVYAYEEHFEKQLAEFRSRREGPILKISEEGVWNARKRRQDFDHATEVEDEMNTYEAAEIEPFRESKTLKNPQLNLQFQQAKILLDQFKFGTKTVSEVFDIDRLAKFYALVDLTRAYHSLIWHNMRFYYNPVTSKLEPIGFDGFTEVGAMKYSYRPLVGTMVVDEENIFKHKIHASAFDDPDLVEKYIFYLNKFSQPAYLNAFFLSVKEPMETRLKLIQPEYTDYHFNPEDWKERATQIQALLRPLGESALKVYTGEKEGALKLLNYHLLHVKVIGFGNSSQKMNDSLENHLFLPSFDKNKLPVFSEIKAPAGAKYVFYQVPGLPEVYSVKISPWQISGAQTPAQSIFENVAIQSNDLYQVEGDRIHFPPGDYQITEDLVFPEGYHIIFSPGVRLDFTKGAAFISRSPVQMSGSVEEPIIVQSSDGTGQGFSIFQANGSSALNYVRFEGMNTLSRKGWGLTGAVTFYESPVEISHSAFTNNHCEDGLNLVRSKFQLSNSTISNTFADGLDVDFGNGNIVACNFRKTGNDGADFSGSHVVIEECNFEMVGDKGISVGENTTIRATNVIIDGAVTGVASKDLSLLRLYNPVIRNCQTALAAYQKKPEFGGGRIILNGYDIDNVKFFKQIEPGSELIINEEEAKEEES